jgi:hypothetical protein
MLFRGEVVEVKLDAPIVSNDFYVSRSFIDLDLGIGYLPPPMDRAWRGQQALVRVLPELSSLIATVYFVYPRQRFVPARVKSFIAYAVERADDFIQAALHIAAGMVDSSLTKPPIESGLHAQDEGLYGRGSNGTWQGMAVRHRRDRDRRRPVAGARRRNGVDRAEP